MPGTSPKEQEEFPLKVIITQIFCISLRGLTLKPKAFFFSLDSLFLNTLSAYFSFKRNVIRQTMKLLYVLNLELQNSRDLFRYSFIHLLFIFTLCLSSLLTC